MSTRSSVWNCDSDILTREFKAHVKEWKNMDRTSLGAEGASRDFYDEHIFPVIKALFRGNRPLKVYGGLILTLGSAPEPLILSILGLKPQHVGLLYTQEGEKFLPQIQEETQLPLGQIHPRKVDGAHIVEVYEAIMTLYDDWGRPEHLAVDITGGRKPMVSGLAMASAVLGADLCYVHYRDFYPELGYKPEPGSEHLILLDNPYTVLGDLDVERAKALYKVHDYAGAQRVFRRLEGQVGDANKAKTYEAYGSLCETYEAWDALDFDTASSSLDRLLKLLQQFSSLSGLAELDQAADRLRKQKKVLQTLLTFRNRDKERLALQAPDGFHFAFMLYHSARRREAQGKLDMACLLLYRLLEWIEQHRLAEHGIQTDDAKYSNRDALSRRYSQKRKELRISNGSASVPKRIGLLDGFLVLYALNDEIVKSLNWDKLQSLVKVRNRSIYTHGMTVIPKEEFQAFKTLVEEQFGQAQRLAGIDDAALFNQQHEFVTL